MKPFPTAIAALMLLAAPALAPAALAEPPVPTLTANGDGSVGAIPDIATVSIGVTTRAKTAREALDANSADIAKVIDTIRGEGIADKDIGTSGFQVYPVYADATRSSNDEGAPQIVGYQVVNEVRVTIRDIAKSGGVLDKVVTAGANQVNGITFGLSDPETPANEALAEAVKNARAKAEIMARAAGLKLVRVLSVNGGGSGPVVYRAAMAADMAKAVPVMPGESQVTANATVTYEVAPE